MFTTALNITPLCVHGPGNASNIPFKASIDITVFQHKVYFSQYCNTGYWQWWITLFFALKFSILKFNQTVISLYPYRTQQEGSEWQGQYTMSLGASKLMCERLLLTYFVSNFFAKALRAASSSVQKGSEGSSEGPFITSPKLFFPIRSCYEQGEGKKRISKGKILYVPLTQTYITR